MHLRAGDWFIYEGEAAAFFVLVEGSFEVLKRYGSTLRQLAVAFPATTWAEIPSVLDGPFIAGAKTLEPSRVMRLDVRDFRRLLVLVPSLRSVSSKRFFIASKGSKKSRRSSREPRS